GNETHPADIPLLDGERVLVLEPQTLSHSWRAGRRHPHIPGSLQVLEELPPGEATAWWSRIHPAGSVRHPMAPDMESDDTGTHLPPRHFGVAAHFAEIDSGPMSSAFSTLAGAPSREDLPASDFLDIPEPDLAESAGFRAPDPLNAESSAAVEPRFPSAAKPRTSNVDDARLPAVRPLPPMPPGLSADWA